MKVFPRPCSRRPCAKTRPAVRRRGEGGRRRIEGRAGSAVGRRPRLAEVGMGITRMLGEGPRPRLPVSLCVSPWESPASTRRGITQLPLEFSTRGDERQPKGHYVLVRSSKLSSSNPGLESAAILSNHRVAYGLVSLPRLRSPQSRLPSPRRTSQAL